MKWGVIRLTQSASRVTRTQKEPPQAGSVFSPLQTRSSADCPWFQMAQLRIFLTSRWCESNAHSMEPVFEFWSFPWLVICKTILSPDAGQLLGATASDHEDQLLILCSVLCCSDVVFSRLGILNASLTYNGCTRTLPEYKLRSMWILRIVLSPILLYRPRTLTWGLDLNSSHFICFFLATWST